MKLKNKIKLGLSIIALLLIASCAKDDPSVLKIYVKSNNDNIEQGVRVRIVGNLEKGTPEHLEEKITNENGAAIYDLDSFFKQYPKKDTKVAYFRVYVKDSTGYFDLAGNAKAKGYITSTETVYIDN